MLDMDIAATVGLLMWTLLRRISPAACYILSSIPNLTNLGEQLTGHINNLPSNRHEFVVNLDLQSILDITSKLGGNFVARYIEIALKKMGKKFFFSKCLL
ncbi:hypothetical protein BpHYR1_010916, partial [Brachionus plicatilis]